MNRPLTPKQFEVFYFNSLHQRNVKNFVSYESAKNSEKTIKDSYKSLFYHAKEQNSVLNIATASLDRYIEENNAIIDIDVLKAYNALKDFLESNEVEL